MNKPTKIFPFRLADAKKGEPIMFRDKLHSFIAAYTETTYRIEDVETKFASYLVDDGYNPFDGKRAYMLTPEPSTIPVGARERFMKEAFFGARDTLNPTVFTLNERHGILTLLNENFDTKCHVEEITDWGFLVSNTLFNDTHYEWVLFSEITFIDR